VNAAHDPFDFSWLPIAIAVASTLQAWVASKWLRRIDPDFEYSGAGQLASIVYVVALSDLIAPTLGHLALLAKGYVSLTQVPRGFLAWWAGDALGTLLIAPLALCLFDRRPLWKTRRMQVALPQGIALTLCLLIFLYMKHEDERRLSVQMDTFAADVLKDLRQLSGHHQKEMASLTALLSIHPAITQQEFSNLSNVLLNSCPGMRSWDWVPLIPPDSTPAIDIILAPGWKPHPSGWKAPVRFIAPLEGNETALGFDQLAEASRAKVILDACSSRALSASPIVRLRRHPVGHRAILIGMPVFRDGQPMGVLRGVIDLEDFQASMGRQPLLRWKMAPVHRTDESLGNIDSVPRFQGRILIRHNGCHWQDTLNLGNNLWQINLFLPHSANRDAIPFSDSQFILLLVLGCCTTLGMASLLFSGEAHRVAKEVKLKTRALEEQAHQRQVLTEHLQTSMDQFDLLVERITVGIFTLRQHRDGTLSFDYVSPRFCQLFEMNQSALMKDALLAFNTAHPDDQASMFLATQISLDSLTPFRWEGRFLIGGEVRWLHIASDISQLPNQERLASGVVSDITEEREIASALAESEERFRDLFDNIPLPIWLFDRESLKFLAVNQAAIELFGYSREEFLQMTIRDIRRAEDPHELEESLLRNETIDFLGIRRHVTKDGRNLLIDIAAHEAMRNGRVVRMAALRDVTEQIESQRELLAAKDLAEAASHAKSEFLANMSHEIRTPMNAILGMIHLSLAEDLTEILRDRLTKTHAAAKTLLTILNDILDFSKIESGRLSLEDIPFALDECLQTLEDLFIQEARAKGLDFHISIDDSVPSYLCGDPFRLRQILSNLVGNAIKFTSSGHVRIHVTSQGEIQDEATLLFSVEDTGIGIEPDQAKRLFQPFSQADNSTTRLFGGTGLGLVISRSLVQMLGGEIHLESQPGLGSTFHFSARFKTAENIPGWEESHSPLSLESRDTARILLVEDNLFNQEVAKGILELSGHRVMIANHGKEALDLFPSQAFDIVLMDLHMPVMGGAEATRILRTLPHGKEVPILALTAAATPEDIAITRDAGMDAHISKPFDPVDLAQTIQVFLQEGRGAHRG
jgi:PAS domain S-box-containing protein